MAVNKVEYGNQTLIDLTTDTVTESDVLEGVTFHNADGTVGTGNVKVPTNAKDITYDNEFYNNVDSMLTHLSYEQVLQSSKVTELDYATKGLGNSFSDKWSSTTLYKVGDYVIYENTLFKCLVQNTGMPPTDSNYWTRVKVTDEINSLNNSLATNISDTNFLKSKVFNFGATQKRVQTMSFSSYATCIILGFMHNYGPFQILVLVNAGNPRVYNLLDGQAVTTLTATYSNGTLTLDSGSDSRPWNATVIRSS